jgi:AhpD family alkylhydroperoxidase
MPESKEYEKTLKDIKETLGFVPGFMKALPQDALVFEWPSFKKYQIEETKIPSKYRELMGLAVAANIKCPYCQYFHAEAAKMNGASDAEMAEAFYLAGMTSRWSTMIHAQRYDYDTFVKEFNKIGEHLQKRIK